MRIVVTIQHPAHVHFFRHAIDELSAAGHDVFVFARENDLAVPLLEAYGIGHEVLAGPQASLLGLARTQLTYEARLLARARRIDPDVMTAIGGVAVSHVAPLVGAKSVVWIDNEGVSSHRLMAPFAHRIYTPATFRDDFGTSHRRYDGFQELAYLHPDRFEPNPDRLEAFGIDPQEPYYVCRFKRWDALHDVGEAGLSRAGKRAIVSLLDGYGTVYVTSSGDLPPDLEAYEQPIPPTHVHDLLHFADGYAGDSATMATEAALLGTPAVRIQSFAGDGDMSNFVVLEDGYGLLQSTDDEREALALLRAQCGDPQTGARWASRRAQLLSETVDVTTVLCRALTTDDPHQSLTPQRVPAAE